MKKGTKIEDLASGKSLRPRPVNFIQQAITIADSYPLSISHGVQKDAIQNGWDARIDKKTAKNWKFDFELVETGSGSYLVMNDFGTYGLTGNLTSDQIEEDEKLSEEERWARWESLAFAKAGPEDIGARGQGKMILVRASQDNMIIYDSLRPDSTYRMGITQAKKTGCPVTNFDNEEGRNKIEEITGLKPIDHQGSRVIIVNPIDELVQAIKGGQFLDFIEETWWPSIKNHGAKISVRFDGKNHVAKVPGIFPIAAHDTKHFKTWVRDGQKIKIGSGKGAGQTLVIETMHFACDLENDAPAQHRGIAVFRGGMKVATVKFPDKQLWDKVYGYVFVSSVLEQQLKELEMPNHYDFRDLGVWKKLRNAIEEELQAFGNKKLGLGINLQEKERTKQNSAENKAMGILRIITKNWPLGQLGSPGPTPGPVDPHPVIKKDIGLALSGFDFPNPENISRLNYGEEINGFAVEIFNKSDKDKKLAYKAGIFSSDRLLGEIDEQNINLGADKVWTSGQTYSLRATEELFPSAGRYSILFTLTDADSKDKIDSLTRNFWVEMEPELRGPFKVERLNFEDLGEDSLKYREWILQPDGSGKYTLLYNIGHPTFLHNDAKEDTLTAYLSEVFASAALQLLVRQLASGEIAADKINALPFNPAAITAGDAEKAYSEVSVALGYIRAKIHEMI